MRAVAEREDRPAFVLAAWQPDASASACGRCQARFGFTVRRHHCRYCGHIFCIDCAGESIEASFLPPLPRRREFRRDMRAQSVVRLCETCDEGLRGLCAALSFGSAEGAEQFVEHKLGGSLWGLARDEHGRTYAHLAAARGVAASASRRRAPRRRHAC